MTTEPLDPWASLAALMEAEATGDDPTDPDQPHTRADQLLVSALLLSAHEPPTEEQVAALVNAYNRVERWFG